jgi:hypothetical protein
VRIVTSGTGEAVAARSSAGALQKRFPLTRGAAAGSCFAAIFEVDGFVEEVAAGPECGQMLTTPDDHDFSFEVTLEAN